MTVVVLEDDAVQLHLMKLMIEDWGLSFTDWRRCRQDILPSETKAVICDWMVPPSWEKSRNNLINLAIESGLPSAIHTAGGINSSSLDNLYPDSTLKLIDKSHDAYSVIVWLEDVGVKSRK